LSTFEISYHGQKSVSTSKFSTSIGIRQDFHAIRPYLTSTW